MNYKLIILLLISFQSFSEDRPLLKIDEIDKYGTFCPNDKNKKYGHHLFFVDTTTPLSKNQITWIKNNLFDVEIIKEIAPYDRISVYQITGRDQEANENEPIFKSCRPLTGTEDTKYKIDQGNSWYGPTKGELKRVWNRFVKTWDLSSIETTEKGSYSVIIESILEASRLSSFDFGDDYEYRRLVIVSDLIQSSSKMSFYDTCDKDQFPDWNNFKETSKYKNLFEFYIPKFNDSVDVEIYYLNSKCDPFLNKGVREFWNGYFADAGLSNVRWLPETTR